MSDTVLIAAFSGRALAESARRSGLRPLVVDCFGDEDTKHAAENLECLPARVQTGFKRKQLLAALDKLVAASSSEPIGIILGGGFECSPKLVEAVAKNFKILGNTPKTIRRTKNPDVFFSILEQHRIPHPKTQRAPPKDTQDWLSKRIGGSGGLHIKPYRSQSRPDSRRYYQQSLPGVPVSLAGVVGENTLALRFYTQWLSQTEKRPFRFGGLAGPISVNSALAARMIDAASTLTEEFQLKGLVSFDFLMTQDDIWLLEINPRPTAALDVQDDENGTILHAHISASQGEDVTKTASETLKARAPSAMGYLYADRGTLNVPEMDWPNWAHDRPIAGTQVKTGQPLASVLTTSENLQPAINQCHNQLGHLEDLLYDQTQ